MKFKLVVLSSILVLFSTTFVTAQNEQSNEKVSIGVRGGFTLPNLTGGSSDDPVSTGYSTATRFGAGVFVEFKISKLFSIQPMLEYSQQGAKRNGMQALVATAPNPDLAGAFSATWQAALNDAPQLGMLNLPSNFPVPPQYLYADAKRSAKMDYLMLPVLAKFGWNLGKTSPWRVYVDAGPYIGLLINAKNIVSINGNAVYADKMKGQLIQLPDEATSMIPPAMLPTLTGAVSQISDGLSTNLASNMAGTDNIKEQLHRFNWGLEGNLGIQYQLHRNKFFLEIGGNYGLMNIQKDTGGGRYLNGKNNIGAATLMIGYAYSL